MRNRIIVIVIFLIMLLAFLCARAQTNVIQVPVGDLGQTALPGVTVTWTLNDPNPRVVNGVAIRQQPVSALTDSNGIAWFTNMVWGYYFVNLSGGVGTTLPVTVQPTDQGPLNVQSLLGRRTLPPNPLTNYYTAAQIDAKIAAIPSGGGTATNVSVTITNLDGSLNIVSNGPTSYALSLPTTITNPPSAAVAFSLTNGFTDSRVTNGLVTTPFALSLANTNFTTVNTVFVDALNGSDAFAGTATAPWATLAHAQTNTPSGWTIAVNPGTYSDVLTNAVVNYYLANGASVKVAFLTGTNIVTGSGNVTFLVAGYNNSYYDITCKTFATSSYITEGSNTLIYVKCDLATNVSVKTPNITASGTYGREIISCNVASLASISRLAAGGGTPNPTVEVYANKSISFQSFSYMAFSANSVLSAPVLNLDSDGSGTRFIPAKSYGFQIDAGKINCFALDPLLTNGMVFSGGCLFDTNVSANGNTGFSHL